MSDTIVDMAKVTQMLDAGWEVVLYRNRRGTYAALASKRKTGDITRREITTDDFTPEQALTRLAYIAAYRQQIAEKVHGENL